MVETGIGSREWADQIIHHMFEEPNMTSEDSKDPFLMGEFEVIKELIKTHPEMAEAKTMVDKMIGTVFTNRNWTVCRKISYFTL